MDSLVLQQRDDTFLCIPRQCISRGVIARVRSAGQTRPLCPASLNHALM